jgi:hypothetical protein
MQRKLSPKESVALKICMREQRLLDVNSLAYREKDQSFSKDYKKYVRNNNDFIDHIYPLLDPYLRNDKERLKEHNDWFKVINKSNTFLTSEGNYAESEEF